MSSDGRLQRDFGTNPPGTTEIQPVAQGDVEAVAALAAEIWWHHYPDIISPDQIEYMLNQRYSPSLLRAELKRSDLWWDKLLVDGKLVGFASYFLFGRAGQMKLDKLYVHPAYQRKGYGGMLIARACGCARGQGCSRLILAVNKANRVALSAYRKHGFRVSDAVVKDIGGGFVMDDYLMELDITDV